MCPLGLGDDLIRPAGQTFLFELKINLLIAGCNPRHSRLIIDKNSQSELDMNQP